MATKKMKEVSPLLPTDWLGVPKYRQRPAAKNLKRSEYIEEVIEDDDEAFDMIEQKKKRNVNMVWIDTGLMVLDFLQIFALLQAMSLRWTWPEDWLRSTYFLFAFNLDIWEMKKFTDPSVYLSVQNYDIESASVAFNFHTSVIVWFIVVAALWVIYGIVYFVIRLSFLPDTRAHRVLSWVQFGYLILMHIITLPFGTVLFKLFQCTSDWFKVDSMNTIDCFSLSHWYLLGPALLFIVVLFVVYPVFLTWKVRKECMSGTSDGYLTFLLMKETEYKIHLNWSWLFDGVFVFSSFKYRGLYHRTIIHVLKLILLIIYTAAYHHIMTQGMVASVILFLCSLLFMILRPYRLTSHNLFLIWSFLSLTGLAFLGALRASYTTETMTSPWLTEGYLIWFLVGVSVLWVLTLLILLVYLVSRTLCHSTKKCYKRPVWPNIATSGSGHLTTETHKFMVAIIRAKIAIDKIRRALPIFAPVYDLARHIQILNAYFRESELLQDALQPALWEVLDDLVETHAEIAPKSLFADSVKKSIKKTAREFLGMVPMFTQRLAQRDYDLILVPPHKRRMLLKMYILGLFLNNRAERMSKKEVLGPALERVWPPLPPDQEFEEEDGYFEDLYPEPIHHPFSGNILKAVVENASDEDSTEDEDNVAVMLRNLPDIEVIDLNTESPEPEPAGDQPQWRSMSATSVRSAASLPMATDTPYDDPFVTVRETSRPSTASSLGSYRQRPSTASSTGSNRPRSAISPEPAGSMASLRTSPPPPVQSPAAGSRVISPVALRPMSASSILSDHSSRPMSAGSRLSEEELGNINPGYIPGDDGDDSQSPPPYDKGDNQAFTPDGSDLEDGGESRTEGGESRMDETVTPTPSSGKHRKGRKKKKKKH